MKEPCDCKQSDHVRVILQRNVLVLCRIFARTYVVVNGVPSRGESWHYLENDRQDKNPRVDHYAPEVIIERRWIFKMKDKDVSAGPKG